MFSNTSFSFLVFVSALVLGSQNASAQHVISWNNVNKSTNDTRLKDGDVVRITETRGGADASHVKIVLRLSGITWRKGIELWKGTRGGKVKLVAQGERKGNSGVFQGLITSSEAQTNTIVLTKAKTFGVQAPMYRIVDSCYRMKAGYTYTFTWSKD